MWKKASDKVLELNAAISRKISSTIFDKKNYMNGKWTKNLKTYSVSSEWNRSRPLSIHCIVDQIVDMMSSLNFSLVLRLTLLVRLGLILHEEATACHTTVVHIQNGTFLNTYELITCFHESWIYDFHENFLVFWGL